MNAPLTILPSSNGAGKPAIELDPRTYRRALSCVHCGLCLPACPTYTTTGHEADSPRGRIQLMRGLADGLVQPTESVTKHLELCLDCRACETACPSGVVYHELIEETRARLAEKGKLSLQERFMRWIFFNVFVHQKRLKLALVPPRLMQKIGLYGLLRKSGIFKLLPEQLRKMEQMLPANGRIWPKALPERMSSTTGTKKATVGFFAGCVGAVMFDEVNRKAAELLVACGAEVITPRSQTCCGAIHHHNAPSIPRRIWRVRTSTLSSPNQARSSITSPATSPAAARRCASTTSCCGMIRSTPSGPRLSSARSATSARCCWLWVCPK
jgi:glycolate oxidase iron-sulfur subunit